MSVRDTIKKYKISFCITCMNRLHHLKQTLPVNIIDNAEYPNLEFVVLDYNSTDDLEEYIKENMQKYIQERRLVYYKTCTPKIYKTSHARNLAFKLATGDLLCSLDGDNFTGEGFAAYINEVFNNNHDIFLSAIDLSDKSLKSDVLGRICMTKEDFMMIRGFDEKMEEHGFEDYDITYRLEMKGVKKYIIKDPDYLYAIIHSNEERIINKAENKSPVRLMICYQSPSCSELLFLFPDHSFRKGSMINNIILNAASSPLAGLISQPEYNYTIKESAWIKGRWIKNKNIIKLIYENDFHKQLRGIAEENHYELSSDTGKLKFYDIKDHRLVADARLFYSQLSNRLIMEDNLCHKRVIVNHIGFGHDIVYKNFDYDHPIII